MTTTVTPEVLFNGKKELNTAMEDAVRIANAYVTEHQNVIGSHGWDGSASGASQRVADEVHRDIQQVLTAGARLADGLGKAADLMLAHQADSEHSLSGVLGASAPASV